ncbi:MAG: hypothetical protein PHD29_04655 [bacterium]|nr:hypothetical protein [bacterium]MDD5756250.1 hypothetical protein [bacterium]
MKLKIRENIFRIAFGLIFSLFHFRFVVESLYFYPLEGLPDNFGVVTYDAPLFFLWDMLKLQAPKWLYNLFFAIGGSVMYIVLGWIIGTMIDTLISRKN